MSKKVVLITGTSSGFGYLQHWERQKRDITYTPL